MAEGQQKQEEVDQPTSERHATASTREDTQDVEEEKKSRISIVADQPYAQQASSSDPIGPVLRIRLDNHVADVVLADMHVYSTHESLKRRVESVVQVATRTITPLAPIHPRTSWVSKGISKRIAVKAES